VWHLDLAGYKPRRPPMRYVLGEGIRRPGQSESVSP